VEATGGTSPRAGEVVALRAALERTERGSSQDAAAPDGSWWPDRPPRLRRRRDPDRL